MPSPGMSHTVGGLGATSRGRRLGGAAFLALALGLLAAGCGSSGVTPAPSTSAKATTSAPAPRPPAPRMSILYDLGPPAQVIVQGAPGLPGLDARRGAYRQEPSDDHLFAGRSDASHRVGKVRGSVLAQLSPAAIASALRRQIDGGCVIDGRNYGCTSHLVAVDEIGNAFNDGPSRPGSSRPDPQSPGARLAAAMRLLDRPSDVGGTYASHVHFYLAPALVTSIGAGLGPYDNLGRDGKPHFQTWRAVMPGLALGGGVWLEMFHAEAGTVSPLSAEEWRSGPRKFARQYVQAGGDPANIHLLLSAASVAPAGATGCSGPMDCTWALADEGANAALLRNGPGEYRVGDQAKAWLREYDFRFG
jgi:hypothetical protein